MSIPLTVQRIRANPAHVHMTVKAFLSKHTRVAASTFFTVDSDCTRKIGACVARARTRARAHTHTHTHTQVREANQRKPDVERRGSPRQRRLGWSCHSDCTR